MPLIYGEGRDRALKRLMREIMGETSEKIRRWLSPPDPSTNYHKERKKQAPETSVWLLEGSEFKQWKSSVDRSPMWLQGRLGHAKASPSSGFEEWKSSVLPSPLWLQESPGFRKTIMSSTVIEHLQQHYHEYIDRVTIYFYFDPNDERKQSLEHMLRSLLYQLLQHSATMPKGIEALFLSHQSGEQQPSIHALIEAIRKAVQDFSQVYIVLDALHECANLPELLLNFVQAVARWNAPNLRLIMSSCRELDIWLFLRGYPSLQGDRKLLHGEPTFMEVKQRIQHRLSYDN